MNLVRSREDAGALGQKRGRAFEKFLDEHLLGPAVKNGLFLRVDRQHPDMAPTNQTASNGSRLFVLRKRSACDWILLLPKGAPVAYCALEAKAIDGESLPLSAIADHQVEHLNHADDAGQAAILLVQFFCPLPEVYGVPWREAPWKPSGNGHSMRRGDLSETWRVRNWQCLGRVLGWTPWAR